ncbi:TIR domain-containing protein [Lysobacter ciconiae]|uniref:TIR domain-containing protein n=1 Tax=Novilysobacter ciconiae TaxID=2781022 RepID=A0A7S6UFX2_9GAMM|nr:TIR domain-containing protein [Lysobacter ciconiae]QOW19494.1 TIR domain-containing protein [Lysobacter ciconiae]
MNSLLRRPLDPTARRQVFYSFHYANDAFRAQQIRNMGVIEGNTPCAPNEWEAVRRQGEAAIQRWIDQTMQYRSCVVVLVGSQTAQRPWIDYEIRKAWNDKRGLFGIYVHNLNCPRQGFCYQGANPFANVILNNGQPLSNYVSCHDPGPDAYNVVRRMMSTWIETAIRTKRQ